MKHISALFFLLLSAGLLSAQQSRKFTFPLAGIADESTMREDFDPVLQCIEMPKPGGVDQLAQIKDSLDRLYRKPGKTLPAQQRTMVAPNAPFIGMSIQGNAFGNSTPNDNEIAISNSGKLVSVQNSNIFRYDVSTSTNLGGTTLSAWSNILGNTQSKFDPKVIYDPLNDRYILICLAGFTDSTSSIILGFSQPGVPTGAWNMYELPGNPLNNGYWTDYPAIAITQQEVFITVNLLQNNMPWQTGFVETLIWQINKNDGYNGDSLSTQLHNNIQFGGRPIRNLCPVKGGSTIYGPDIYFLSNRNLDVNNDTIFLVHLTDTMNAPGQQITVQPLVSNVSYWAPANAQQQGFADRLATNDARVLGAFIENNMIQFVQNTMDTTMGQASFLHGMISNVSSSPSLFATIMSDTIEYGYPNIAYAGIGPGDNTAVIGVLHSSVNVKPGVSAIVCDGTPSYSGRTVVKQGLGYISLISGDERWGDYSGMQRRYNTTGTVWMNGMYGQASHTHSTWITELGISADVGFAVNSNPVTDVTVFPNPSVEIFDVTFSAGREEQVDFALYDLQGRLVKLLLRERVKTGVNRFSFSAASLSKGIYVLKISSPQTVYTSKEIVKQ
ncbi:MAG: hypothetical protein FD123_2935 [Bacteroidetes bacterium]|nr:MAG: hypothetical protein FD123_2935 [Bacteroidota bacterium]